MSLRRIKNVFIFTLRIRVKEQSFRMMAGSNLCSAPIKWADSCCEWMLSNKMRADRCTSADCVFHIDHSTFLTNPSQIPFIYYHCTFCTMKYQTSLFLLVSSSSIVDTVRAFAGVPQQPKHVSISTTSIQVLSLLIFLFLITFFFQQWTGLLMINCASVKNASAVYRFMRR